MKKIFLILTSILFLAQSYGQLEIDAGKYPVNKVVEWKNVGTLIMNTNPDIDGKDLNVTLLDTGGMVTWTKMIYPSYSRPSLILSEDSDYIYFIDYLEVKDNRISYIQMNRSGSYVATKIDLLKIVRSYGYTIPNDLVLEEVVNTPKALAFHFTLDVKDKNIVENIFVTVTHHNNRVYHLKGPNTNPDMVKEGREGLFTYSGANARDIYFSRLIKQGENHRIHFYPMTPKAAPGLEYSFATLKGFKPVASEIVNHNLCGSYYKRKNGEKTIERNGLGLFLNEQFYFVANEENDRCLKVYGVNSEGNAEVLNECKNTADKSRKYNSKITWLYNLDKIIVSSELDKAKNAAILKKDKVKMHDAEKLNIDLLQINPSSFGIENKSTNFVHLVGDKQYFFDLDQLGKEGVVVFKEK